MDSFFRSLFSCCLRRKLPPKQETVDEESRLIPPPPAEPSPPPLPGVVVIDQQKLKAKLNSIVRSKEGKMVNVNARLPFNLHNKTLSHTLDAHNAASSSRSTSLSIHSHSYSHSHPKPSPSLSPLSNTPHTHTQVHAHVGAPLSFDPPTNASSTRSSSRDGADLEVYTRSRILNLRLVHRNGTGQRGRSRIKAADGERGDSAAPEGGAVEPDPIQSTSALPQIDFSALPAPTGDIDLYSPVSTVMEGTPRASAPLPTTSSLSSPQMQRPGVSIAPSSSTSPAFDFKIQDTGALCISWGD